MLSVTDYSFSYLIFLLNAETAKITRSVIYTWPQFKNGNDMQVIAVPF